MDQDGLDTLRALNAEGAALVYVPTHKSHVDYLFLRQESVWARGLGVDQAWRCWCLLDRERAAVLCCAVLCCPSLPAHQPASPPALCSYILFAAGLPCPHIAAGDNLALPLVGAWLRACGAFFIRRTARGSRDGALYKRVLAGACGGCRVGWGVGGACLEGWGG